MIAQRRKGWIGVDIGTRSLKLAQIERHAKGLRLLDAQVVPLTVSSRPDDNDASERRFTSASEAIECALSLGKRFAGTAAVCALTAAHYRFRPIIVPTGSIAEQRAVVGAELNAVEKIPPEDRWFSFWPTGNTAADSDESQTEVIAHSMSRHGNQWAATEVLRAGLFSHALDSPPLALARAVAMTSTSEQEEPVAALDWGFSTATFCVIQRGIPVFVRQLRDCGFQHVLASLRAALGLSLEHTECLFPPTVDAARMKRGEVSDAVQKAVPEMAIQPLNRLVAELQRTERFVQSRASFGVPRKMWLFGGGALWGGARDYLADRIEPRAERWTLEATPIEDHAGLGSASGLWGVAIGASSFPWSQQ